MSKIKPISNFVNEFPLSANLLLSYKEATGYLVNERKELVLYKDENPIVFITSLDRDINF